MEPKQERGRVKEIEEEFDMGIVFGWDGSNDLGY